MLAWLAVSLFVSSSQVCRVPSSSQESDRPSELFSHPAIMQYRKAACRAEPAPPTCGGKLAKCRVLCQQGEHSCLDNDLATVPHHLGPNEPSDPQILMVRCNCHVRCMIWHMCACLQVMMEFRNTDSRHVDWVKALKQLFQQLKAYVKQHHMAGPSWNPTGIPLTDFKADKNASAASNPAPALASASVPRPPPPGTCQRHTVRYPSDATGARIIRGSCC